LADPGLESDRVKKNKNKKKLGVTQQDPVKNSVVTH
jgi:hypothetical protein